MPPLSADAGFQRDLIPVNAVIGFLKRDRRWPSELYRIGCRLSFLRKQSGKFSLRHLLEETFPDWQCMGTDLHRHLSSRAKEIVTDLCKNELKGMAQIVKQATSPADILVEFTEGVLGSDASARTKAFQRLARLAEGYSKRIKENRPYEPGREPESGWLPFPEPDSD
jgi:hypothetical protein